MKTNKIITILLIEDEPSVVTVIKGGFEALMPLVCKVDDVSNLLDYQKSGASRRKFNVYIVDLALSVGAGFSDAFKIIEQVSKKKPKPLVIVYSGHPSAQNQKTAIGKGADIFIPKTNLTPDKIANVVREKLDL